MIVSNGLHGKFEKNHIINLVTHDVSFQRKNKKNIQADTNLHIPFTLFLQTSNFCFLLPQLNLC